MRHKSRLVATEDSLRSTHTPLLPCSRSAPWAKHVLFALQHGERTAGRCVVADAVNEVDGAAQEQHPDEEPVHGLPEAVQVSVLGHVVDRLVDAGNRLPCPQQQATSRAAAVAPGVALRQLTAAGQYMTGSGVKLAHPRLRRAMLLGALLQAAKHRGQHYPHTLNVSYTARCAFRCAPGASWSTLTTMVCGLLGFVTETAMYRTPLVTSSTEFSLQRMAHAA